MVPAGTFACSNSTCVTEEFDAISKGQSGTKSSQVTKVDGPTIENGVYVGPNSDLLVNQHDKGYDTDPVPQDCGPERFNGESERYIWGIWTQYRLP